MGESVGEGGCYVYACVCECSCFKSSRFVDRLTGCKPIWVMYLSWTAHRLDMKVAGVRGFGYLGGYWRAWKCLGGCERDGNFWVVVVGV